MSTGRRIGSVLISPVVGLLWGVSLVGSTKYFGSPFNYTLGIASLGLSAWLLIRVLRGFNIESDSDDRSD